MLAGRSRGQPSEQRHAPPRARRGIRRAARARAHALLRVRRNPRARAVRHDDEQPARACWGRSRRASLPTRPCGIPTRVGRPAQTRPWSPDGRARPDEPLCALRRADHQRDVSWAKNRCQETPKDAAHWRDESRSPSTSASSAKSCWCSSAAHRPRGGHRRHGSRPLDTMDRAGEFVEMSFDAAMNRWNLRHRPPSQPERLHRVGPASSPIPPADAGARAARARCHASVRGARPRGRAEVHARFPMPTAATRREPH